MDEEVSAALSAAFPGRDVLAVDEAGPSWNEGNRTVRVAFADAEPVFLKLATDGRGERIARERAVLAYLAERDAVAAPDVVAADVDRDVPYLATAVLPGRPLHAVWDGADRRGRETLARQVGRALATLHESSFDRHGRIVGGEGGELTLDTGPWPEVLADTIEELRALAGSSRYEWYFDEVLLAIAANREVLVDAPAALLHGDPAKPNVLVEGDVTDAGGAARGTEPGADSSAGTLGFVDWERAHVGDPARELVRVRDQQFAPLQDEAPRPLVDALHDGYRERAGNLPDGFAERRPIYEAVRFLGVAGSFEKYSRFVDEPEPAFASWVEAEMDRLLDRL